MKLNQSEFFQANQVDGKITDQQAMQMLFLPEGDTAQADSGVPDAEEVTKPEDQKATSQPEPADKPADPPATETPAQADPVAQVILAKDGVHTIPFEKLTEARAAEQHWKEVAAQMQAQLEAAQKQPPAAQAPATPNEGTQEATGEDLFGDFSEEAL